VPDEPRDIFLPQDLAPGDIGATGKPSRIPRELSDTAWFTERALEYLHGARGKPWLLHLGYWRPHPPFSAPAPYHAMYDPAQCPPPVRAASVADEAAQHPLLRHYLGEIQRKKFFEHGQGLAADMSEAEVRQMRATYYGLMTEVDDQLGRVFQFLKNTGQWDDTLIVLTSDHAEQLGDHHLLGKLGYFDQSYHIPMIVRDPRPQANATRGSLIEHFTETIDTLPTILEWLGLPLPRACDGHSLLPFVTEGRAPEGWRTEAHYEFDYRNLFYSKPQDSLALPMDDCSLAVVRDDDFKYVHFPALPPLFFDLKKDPGQFHNVADDPAYAPLALKYARKMLDWRLRHAERTLTGYAATPEGLTHRMG
jgi:arylsulfatase A-like enzyme